MPIATAAVGSAAVPFPHRYNAMARLSLILNVVLAAAVAVQGWALHVRKGRTDPPLQQTAGVDERRFSPAMRDRVEIDRLEARLARIDARLAGLPTAEPPASREAPAPAPDMTAVEADRRLHALMPLSEIDARELARFHAQLAGLPPGEQFAIAAAMSRAINDRRIRVRP